MAAASSNVNPACSWTRYVAVRIRRLLSPADGQHDPGMPCLPGYARMMHGGARYLEVLAASSVLPVACPVCLARGRSARWSLLEHVVNGDKGADQQRHGRAEEGDAHRGQVADVADPEPDDGRPDRPWWQRFLQVVAPDRPPEQQGEAQAHAQEDALVDRGGELGILAAVPQVVGDRGGRERDR